MSSKIILVRHAESRDSIERRLACLAGLSLTTRGIEQCVALKARLDMETVDLVVSSPLRRATDTVKQTLSSSRLDIIPELAEIGFGEEVSSSQALGTFEAVQHESLDLRCKYILSWLAQRPGRTIVVVSHAGLLHHLTRNGQRRSGFFPRLTTFARDLATRALAVRRLQPLIYFVHLWSGLGWRNAEMRYYQLSNGTILHLIPCDHLENLLK